MEAATVPERPLLKPWFRRCDLPDGVLFEHGRSTVRFRGAAATRLLPLLLPLLDGRRAVPEIVAAVGAPAEPAIAAALELLARHALLTSGPAEPAVPGLGRTALALAQRGTVAPEEIRKRLASCRILLEGDRELVAPLGRLLCGAGLGGRLAHDEDGAFVVTAVVAAGDPRLARRNETALERRASWLPVGLFDGDAALVGPLVLPWESACHRCLVVRRDAAAEGARELAGVRAVPSTAPLAPGLAELVAGVALDVVLRWIGLRDPFLPGTAAALRAGPDLHLASHRILRVPRCPACSPAARTAPPTPWHEAAA